MPSDIEGFEAKRVRLDDADLYVRHGGSGPPLVLLHGMPQHGLMWHTVAPLLFERFTVIVPDQRGAGASSSGPGPHTKTRLAADLAAVLDAFDHDRAHIAGYDLGAGVAIALARDFSERVDKLCVMEFGLPGFGFEAELTAGEEWTNRSNWHLGLFTLPDVALWLFQGREREMLAWFFWHLSHQGQGAVSEAHLDLYARTLSQPGSLRACFEYYAAVWQDARDNASLGDNPIANPALAIGGESSSGPALEQIWAPVLKDFETRVVPGAGHWLGDENPRDVAKALLDFFGATDQSK